jgi:FAD/FMN-containing dehydrogenase
MKDREIDHAKTYFITLRVTPLAENPLIEKVEEARVYFWIVDTSPEKAMKRASEYLVKYRWKLNTLEKEPMEVTAADFADQQDGMTGFWKAKQKGFAAQFVAKPKPGVKNVP